MVDVPSKIGRSHSKTVASLIREALERNGYKDVKDCARAIKVPYDLFNKVVGGHIPKDAQLIEYARKLKIDHRELVLAAYKEKAPEDMKRFFNSAVLLEKHNDVMQEMLDILDSFTSDQLNELLQAARQIRQSPPDQSRKAMSLLAMYHQMDKDMLAHFDNLVLMALRNEDIPALKNFKAALGHTLPAKASRKARA